MKDYLKRLIALAMVLCMALALAACGSSSADSSGDDGAADSSSGEVAADSAPTEDTSGSAVSGGTLSVAYTEFYGEYDPAAANNRCYIYMYYDMLWQPDWDVDRDEFNYVGNYLDVDHIVGSLAESWEVADDYSSLTVHLRDDVYFQDKVAAGFDEEYDIYGARQLVASDVKWSYDRLLGYDGTEIVELDQTTWAEDASMLESVEVIDDFTVKFNFNTTNAVSIDDFMVLRINIAGPEWDELTHDQKNDWHYACGTGPFILTDYITDNTMTFVKNPNYWDTDSDGNQLPYLDGVELIYITDTSTELASFISGEIDAIPAFGTVFDSDQASQVDAALGDGYYTNSKYSAPMSIGLKQGNNPVEALTNDTVRKAMQYAIDVAAISDYMGYGYT